MLKNTFCHIPGIGKQSEQGLWSRGILCWDDILKSSSIQLPGKKLQSLKSRVTESSGHLEQNDPKYFADSLPSSQQWRLLPDFRHSIAYLDIETTGLGGCGDYITTIVLYDGKSIFSYVRGRNLEDFRRI